jgi:hypothetical protein
MHFYLDSSILLPDVLCMKENTANIRQHLAELAKIAAGYPFRGAIGELQAGDVAVIQMANLDIAAGVDWKSLQRVSLPPGRSTGYLQAGDVIFTTRGTRNHAVALDHVPEPTVCTPQLFVIRVNDPSVLSPRFLAWQINQRPAQEYFQREATGSYILNIRREVIEGLPVAVPSLARQRAIMGLADAANRECAALARLIENRNQQIEAIAMDLHRTERLEA